MTDKIRDELQKYFEEQNVKEIEEQIKRLLYGKEKKRTFPEGSMYGKHKNVVDDLRERDTT